jgi:hypothetical protein
MKLESLLSVIEGQIMVTGPQRSGTTIAALILAQELGYPCYLEEHFGIHNLKRFFEIYSATKFVVQAPALSAYTNLIPGSVVFMMRPINEIICSQERISWNEEEIEKAKYFSDSKLPIAVFKYKIWEQYQKHQSNRFELEYHSLKDNPLWVDETLRINFHARQTVP